MRWPAVPETSKRLKRWATLLPRPRLSRDPPQIHISGSQFSTMFQGIQIMGNGLSLLVSDLGQGRQNIPLFGGTVASSKKTSGKSGSCRVGGDEGTVLFIPLLFIQG